MNKFCSGYLIYVRRKRSKTQRAVIILWHLQGTAFNAERCYTLNLTTVKREIMEKSSSEDSSIHRSPSLDSKDSDFAKPSTSGRQFGRGFTAGAFYGTTGSRTQSRTGLGTGTGIETGVKSDKYSAPKGSKYVVFYLDLSFVFLLEFKKCNMARGCLCCLKYMMFLFNLIFWVSTAFSVPFIC